MENAKNPENLRLIGGRYELRSTISDKPSSQIWLANDTATNDDVVVKLLPPRTVVSPQDANRFRRVSSACMTLKSDHILQTLDFGIDSNDEHPLIPFVVTEFVDGINLRSFLDSEHVDMNTAIEIAAQVATALDAAHSSGLLHNDIKPSNIMIVQEIGQICAKLADFGAADTGPTSAGTAKYASPERLRHLPTDTRSDLYSLGVVLYEMLTGQAPFQGNSEREVAVAQVNEVPKPVNTVNPKVPQSIVTIVDRLLQKKPSERFSSAIAVRNALRYNRDDAAITEERDPTPKRGTPQITSAFYPERRGLPKNLRKPVIILLFALVSAVFFIIFAIIGSL